MMIKLVLPLKDLSYFYIELIMINSVCVFLLPVPYNSFPGISFHEMGTSHGQWVYWAGEVKFKL